MVDGWRALNTTQSTSPQITRMVDVAWIDANDAAGARRADQGCRDRAVPGDRGRLADHRAGRAGQLGRPSS